MKVSMSTRLFPVCVCVCVCVWGGGGGGGLKKDPGRVISDAGF
jgi:hypothetical protein